MSLMYVCVYMCMYVCMYECLCVYEYVCARVQPVKAYQSLRAIKKTNREIPPFLFMKIPGFSFYGYVEFHPLPQVVDFTCH